MTLPNIFAPLTPQARRYAVKELARRAGVTRECFHSWKIEVAELHTAIHLAPGQSPQIIIEHASPQLVDRLATGDFPVARASRDHLPGGTSSIPVDASETDLVIPFYDLATTPDQPLFQATAANDATGRYVCRADILLSTLFTLCRAEESIPGPRDEHLRFPASAGIAAQHGFLERPIIDEYGLALREVIAALLPGWSPSPRQLRVKLTHDIDGVGIPFSARTAIGHTFKRKLPACTARDFLSAISPSEPTELCLVRKLAQISKARGLHSAFYWKGSARGPMDEGYDPFHPKVQRVMHDLRELGFELGVHPAYDTFRARDALRTEVDRLRSAIRIQNPGGRQHYLRWSPETWLDWEACGLSYDSSVGFADQLGFRAGTSIPYRPWSIAQNREINLVEVPLVLMDCTPVKYMGLSLAQGLERVRLCVERTARVGGVFTVLWHNFPLIEPEYAGWYEAILDLLPRGQPFHLPTNAAEFW